MKWTSVLFLLGYCQKATQNGFRLYVQFEQINKGMFVQATFLYPENFTHSAKTLVTQFGESGFIMKNNICGTYLSLIMISK
jgi:hypothetical protein